MANTFIDGMIVKKPHENAPSFIKATISVKVIDFVNFAKKHHKNGWLNIDLKKSKEGRLYLSLDEFEPKKKDELPDIDLSEEIKAEDLPF